MIRNTERLRFSRMVIGTRNYMFVNSILIIGFYLFRRLL